MWERQQSGSACSLQAVQTPTDLSQGRGSGRVCGDVPKRTGLERGSVRAELLCVQPSHQSSVLRNGKYFRKVSLNFFKTYVFKAKS